LLHFGAVDQEAKVYVNNIFVEEHKGGYLPFCFHIEDVVRKGEENSLRVEVIDRLGTKYPYLHN
jgi:beta-galactosidase/beta-glucuronidase